VSARVERKHQPRTATAQVLLHWTNPQLPLLSATSTALYIMLLARGCAAGCMPVHRKPFGTDMATHGPAIWAPAWQCPPRSWALRHAAQPTSKPPVDAPQAYGRCTCSHFLHARTCMACAAAISPAAPTYHHIHKLLALPLLVAQAIVSNRGCYVRCISL
jgi:hypothetical protein